MTRRVCHTGEEAINRGLAKRLDALSKERERANRAAAAADEQFSSEFLSAAREVFQMIDEDESGTLEKQEEYAVRNGTVRGDCPRSGCRTHPCR